MSLFFRGRHQRAADDLLEEVASRRRVGAPGAAVAAPGLVAVGASQRLLVNIVRGMPADVYRDVDGQRVEAPRPQLLVDPDGARRGLRDFLAATMWSAVARGNWMWRVIAWSPSGSPAQLQVLHPDKAKPHVDELTGELTWKVGALRLPSRDVVHGRLYPVPGAVLGLSPIEQHAETIGLGWSARKFGRDYFDAGGHPTVALETDAQLKTPESRAVKEQYLEGSADRSVIVLPGGIKANRIQISPDESQFLATQEYSAAECARIYGPGLAEILGYQSGGSMTYSNIADRNQHLLTYTVDPYLVLLEDAMSALLPAPRYVRFNRAALLRMTTLDRYRAYEIAARVGLQTPNEQRALEDLPPVGWGEKPYPVKSTTPAAAGGQTDPQGETP